MPKSKHGKNHKKKVAEYKKQIQATNKRIKEERMKELMERIQSYQKLSHQVNSEIVDGESMDIDLDMNLDNDIDFNVDNISIDGNIKVDN
jgi:ribonuclease PH